MGATAHLRPIEPGDRERLRRFHARLSADTVYRRYHGLHAWLAEGELDFLCGADGRRHIAWVACDDDGELVGVCRLIGERRHPRTGEIAVVVADAAQHAGIGHGLVGRVLDEAARAGFRRADALILPTNGDARHLFASVAAERAIAVDEEHAGGVVELHLHLAH